jgi:NADPH:quinone reductase-like Zn-dependent oxidoreductase
VSFELVAFYRKELQLFGVDSLHRDLTNAAETLRELTAAFDAGVLLPPRVSQAFPLDQAPEAYRLVAAGSNGRVVLKPN